MDPQNIFSNKSGPHLNFVVDSCSRWYFGIEVFCNFYRSSLIQQVMFLQDYRSSWSCSQYLCILSHARFNIPVLITLEWNFVTRNCFKYEVDPPTRYPKKFISRYIPAVSAGALTMYPFCGRRAKRSHWCLDALRRKLPMNRRIWRRQLEVDHSFWLIYINIKKI